MYFATNFKNIFAKDDFINKSDFITNRFGSDRIHKTPWEKMSNAGQVFMNATDYFTANLIARSKYYETLSKGMSESEAMKKAEYMEEFVGQEFDGIVGSVVKFGMFVELPNTIEGLVHITTLPEFYNYNERTMTLQGEKTGKTFRVGQPIRVK